AGRNNRRDKSRTLPERKYSSALPSVWPGLVGLPGGLKVRSQPGRPAGGLFRLGPFALFLCVFPLPSVVWRKEADTPFGLPGVHGLRSRAGATLRRHARRNRG